LQSFNPRAHAGRDNVAGSRPGGYFKVSIHAPTRGATAKNNSLFPKDFRFNPRAHAGRDVEQVFHYASDTVVSIHAPTRGAT